jgi:hypothetical protein
MTLSLPEIELIAARTAHEANAAYCVALGDHSQAAWYFAPAWQQDSALAGVRFLLANPDAGDDASHESWRRAKVEDGWIYGPEKNAEAKTHPCLVPFDELPPEQQRKDRLFRAVVTAVLGALS